MPLRPAESQLSRLQNSGQASQFAKLNFGKQRSEFAAAAAAGGVEGRPRLGGREVR